MNQTINDRLRNIARPWQTDAIPTEIQKLAEDALYEIALLQSKQAKLLEQQAAAEKKHSELLGRHLDALRRVNVAYGALHRLAAYHDEGANKALYETGSYSSFDEPNAVRVARETIAKLEAPVVRGRVEEIFDRARATAEKASGRFPQPNYVALKIAEEAGDVVRGCVHYAENRMEWAEVEGEIVQLIAMLIRLITEGDQINGITPPHAMIEAAKGE